VHYRVLKKCVTLSLLLPSLLLPQRFAPSRLQARKTIPATTTTTGSTSTTTTTTTPTAPVVYSAQLSWTAPTTRADGTPLTSAELAGYEIYYTTDDPAVAGTISVASSTAANYTLSNLAAGNYYFAMSAIDTTGLKSALSAMAPIKFGP